MSHISGTVDVLDLSSLLTRPASAGNPDGSYVLAQAGAGASIVIHGFGPDGENRHFTLEVNAAPVRLWLMPRPGEGETGYVLMWAATKGAGLFQQILDASGQPVGDVEMLQDDNGAIPFLNAALSPLSNGNWLASYEHWDGLMLQMVDSAGEPVGDPVVALQFIFEYTAIPDGEGGVFLLGFNYEGYDSVYFAYHYDAQLQLLSFERLWVTNYASIATATGPGESVSAYVESNQLFVNFIDLQAGETTNTAIFDLPTSVRNMSLSLTQLSDGDILATWTRTPQGGTPVLQGLRMNADGSLDGAVFDIAALPGLHPTTPATVTALPDGDFSIAFLTSDGGSKEVRQLSVDYVGDAPKGHDTTITLAEDEVHVFAADDFQFSDANNDGLAAIEITALPEQGTLFLNGVRVAAGQVIDAGDIGLLAYRPDADQHGSGHASLDFRVIDGGRHGPDGSRNMDNEANTITFDVTPVDDAPTGRDKTVTLLEDEPYGFTASDFGFSDPDGQSFAMLQVTSLPPGLLLLEGRSVSAGEKIAYGDIAKLVYIPAADASGIASFTFQVIDQGTSSNIDPVPKTFRFEISPVNDAPSGTDRTIDLLEDKTYTFAPADFGFTDTADGHALAGVKFETLPVAGTLMLSGKALKAGQIVTSADLGKLVYTPAANTTAPVSFTFQVIDNGGTANGGVDADQTTNVFRFAIKPVNDAPSGTDRTIELLEDKTYAFKTADFGFIDKADGHALAGVKFTTLPTAGTLTLSGKALKAGQIVTSADLGKLVYTPVANATAPVSFTFQVIDNGGTANGGVDTDPTPNVFRFSIKPVNDAPSGTDRTIELLEDNTYAFKTADFGFTDTADGHALAGVKFTTLPTAGTLTLSGKALKAGQIVTSADFGKLVYTPAANATAPVSFTFQVIDNGGTANGGVDADQTPNVFRFSIKPVNDAPSGTDRTIELLEDNTYAFKTADFGFIDKADGHALAGMKFETLPVAGTLMLSGKALKAGQIVTSADLGKLVYTPVANVTAPVSFTFQVIDNGGKANGGVDTDPTPNVFRFSIKPVNDAPSGTDRTIELLEDKTYAFKTADFGFTDKADGHALAGVKFTTLPVAGTLTLSGKALEVGQIVTSADLGKLVYTPVANATAPVSFTFQVIDNGGTANGGVDTDPTPNVFRFSIKPVNDAPSGTDRTIELLEDKTYALKTADSGFTDKADGHALAGVKFTTLPTAGTLTLSGKALKAGQIVTSADLGKLVYTPAANVTAPVSFTFQVIDNGGTANGGIDTDPTPNVFRFAIKPVNDAPSGTDRTIELLEDKTYAFKTADFGFTDKADGHALAGVKFTTLPTAGTLTLSGKALKAGEIVTAADIGKLVYTTVANATAPVSFTFQVIDNGGTANGGVDADPTPNVFRLSIKPVNDAPSGTDRTIELLEDKRYIFKTGDFGFSDKIDGNAFHSVKISALPTAGSLTFAGKAVKSGQIVSIADVGKLAYTPPANDFGKGLASMKFQVIDNGGTVNGGKNIDPTPNTVTFSVADVTDIFRGTSKAETLKGTKGKDVLDGRAGADTLTGGSGADTFVFKTGYDRDKITDFTATGSSHDILDLTALKSVTSFADLKKNHLSSHAADVWIDGGRGDVLILKGVKIGDLTKGDFLF